MMKKNVLLLETIADEAFQLLADDPIVYILTAYSDKPLSKILVENDIDAVITRGKGQVNKQLMAACPNLKVAARCGVGLDNVDVKEATARNIMVVNAPGSNAATIAEHTISLILTLQRNLYQSINEVKADNWNWRNQFEGDELNGKTLGILGLGNIGKKVAKIAEALGMNVVYWGKNKHNVPYKYLPFEELLNQADIITLHLPLVDDTKLLIDAKALSLMKPTAILINTARGIIIDEEALFQALQNKIIAGFGADVLTTEPPNANNPLLSHPKALITAHVGSLTATTYTRMCVSTVKNVLAILNGREPELESVFNRMK